MSIKNKKWINLDGSFKYENIPSVHDTLPIGVYELNIDKSGLYLEMVGGEFELPTRLYGTETDLIKRVKHSFNHFDKNFGILLKGTKGTGKTITAKQLCNELKLPVILVNAHLPNMGFFINSIKQDVILFFDEFEKTYEFTWQTDDDGGSLNDSKPGVSNLLTLMDGVFTSEYKRLFILTTNKDYLPDAMMSRPSRIRYVKSFDDLSMEAVNEILNDIVENKELIPELVDILKELEIVTVDIVKSVAEEASLFNTADPKFFEIFNIKKQDTSIQVVEIGKDVVEKEAILIDDCQLSFDRLKRGHGLTFDNGGYYYVATKDPENQTITLVNAVNGDWTEWNKGNTAAVVTKQVVLKKVQKYHKSFNKYAI